MLDITKAREVLRYRPTSDRRKTVVTLLRGKELSRRQHQACRQSAAGPLRAANRNASRRLSLKHHCLRGCLERRPEIA